MKYTYKIAIKQKDPLIEKIEKRYNPYIKKTNDIWIQEFCDGKLKYVSDIEDFKSNSNIKEKLRANYLESHIRIKKWVLENHPELLI